jgi:hypothetical protein
MKFVVLRGEEPPDDVTVVVRGGENGLGAEVVRRSASRNLKALGFLGLSVYLAVDQSVEALCSDTDELRRYGQVRTSTVRRVHAAGFALLATGDRPHFDIVLPDLAEPTLERLAAAFDPPERNPGRQR